MKFLSTKICIPNFSSTSQD